MPRRVRRWHSFKDLRSRPYGTGRNANGAHGFGLTLAQSLFPVLVSRSPDNKNMHPGWDCRMGVVKIGVQRLVRVCVFWTCWRTDEKVRIDPIPSWGVRGPRAGNARPSHFQSGHQRLCSSSRTGPRGRKAGMTVDYGRAVDGVHLRAWRKSVRLRTSIRRRWRRCRWAIVPRFHPPRWMQNSASRSESSLRIQTKQERQGHPSINRIFTTVEIVLSCLVFVPPPPRLDSSVLQLDSQAPQIPGFFVDFNAFPMLSHAVPGTVMTP